MGHIVWDLQIGIERSVGRHPWRAFVSAMLALSLLALTIIWCDSANNGLAWGQHGALDAPRSVSSVTPLSTKVQAPSQSSALPFAHLDAQTSSDPFMGVLRHFDAAAARAGVELREVKPQPTNTLGQETVLLRTSGSYTKQKHFWQQVLQADQRLGLLHIQLKHNLQKDAVLAETTLLLSDQSQTKGH